MARNTYGVDEKLETPFNAAHLKRSLVYVKKYAGEMVFSLAMTLLASIVSLINPIVVQKALDEAIPAGDVRGLLILTGLLIGTVVVFLILIMLRSYVMAGVGQNLVFDIRQDLFEHLQKLSFSYYDSRPQGKILVRVVSYVNNVSDMLTNGIINVIIEVVNIFLIIVFMLRMDAKLALLVLAGLPVLLVVILLLRKAQRKAWQDVSNKNSNLSAYFCENVEGVKVAQAFCRQERNESIFADLCQKLRSVWMHCMRVSNLVWFSTENISMAVTCLMYLGALAWFDSGAKVGVIVAMAGYASRFWQPILNLSNLYNNFINTLSYLERIFETMDEPVEIEDAPDAEKMPPIRGEVEFRNVSFEYEKGVPVLDNVSFHVKPGQSVALVGPTGSGKTTVVNLLSRFYDRTQGQILIDGHDIARCTLRSVRGQMGIMMQDAFIFSGTLEENIRYGTPDASPEAVEAAAKAVRAHDFIAEFPDGYATAVNERGGRLSQGQKQLIALARTMLKDPKILILDEATSSIDPKTEKLLQEGIDRLLKGRTSFIIAHRLSTVQNCDLILFVDGGRIAEAGSHEELLARKGRYYELCKAQGLL